MAARDYRLHGERPAGPVLWNIVSWVENVRVRLGTTWRLLLKELSAFGIVGAVCFVVDVGLFQLLYAHAGVGAIMQLYTLARSCAGKMTPKYDADVRNITVYQHFMALTAAVTYATIGLFPGAARRTRRRMARSGAGCGTGCASCASPCGR